ncbi:MAG TPA: RNA polymerase sigma-70 factor [Puia sp.]|jgi:RNA polymerase sigma-70 factor (ECF subfamily)
MTILSRDHEQVVEELFAEYFGKLYAYAFSMLGEEGMAEEVVQNVYCRLWEKREQLQVHTSVKAYLYRSVHHECLDSLRRRKIVKGHRSWLQRSGVQVTAEAASGKIELKELEKRLREVLDELPDQCRTIFRLSRFGELKYREIAVQLGLSVKTVEAQMAKALKRLREKLVDLL